MITAGTPNAYVKEVLPGASILKLAISYPLPMDLIRAFCATVEARVRRRGTGAG